jgi:hypothetical protein
VIVPSQVRLPTLIYVIVFVNRRMVAQQNEFVGVSPKPKIKFRALAQILFQARKPGLRSLPGIKRPIKLISAERLVTVPKHEQGMPGGTLQLGVGKKSQTSVIPVRAKAAGEIPLGVKLLVTFRHSKAADPLC